MNTFAQAELRMHGKIEAALNGKPRLVHYSAYEDDVNDMPIDNLDEIAAHGACQFKHFTGKLSDIVINPTWLQVAIFANESIEASGDYHHVFLEQIRFVGEKNHVKRYEVYMGS
jgi:hypothetical protein